ncbi:MAG: S9 family peptidase [Planctomycetota bacterium]|nr:S9 family peptidase [Planctomycetota bacterium]
MRIPPFLCVFVAACAAAAPPAASFSLEEALDRGRSRLPGRFAFSKDGGRIGYLQQRADGPLSDLWVYDVATGRKKIAVSADGEQDLTPEQEAARERRRERARGVTRFAWNPVDASLLVPLSGDLYVLRAGELTRLTKTKEPERDPQWSPNGRAIAFVRDRNLFVLEREREHALTENGKGKIRCGLAEFIAMEELGRHRGYWWAPDSNRIAYVETDSAGVPLFHMHDYLQETGRSVPQEYPRAGDRNVAWRLGVVEARGGETVWMRIEGEYLARVDWTPDGQLVAQVLDRPQKVLTLYRCDPATGRATILFQERDDAWVELHRNVRFLSNGRILWTSQRSGYRHLYLFSGRGFRALTFGEWDVTRVVGVDEKKEQVYFTAARPTALERNLFRVGLEGSDPVRLTPEPGWHGISMAPDYRHFLDTYSRAHLPPRITLRAIDGKDVAEIGKAPRLRVDPPQFLEVPGADGRPLHAMLMRSRLAGPRPAIVYVYGGPGSQNVADRWRGAGFLFNTRLTQLGYSIFVVDNRGCAGRGRDFTRTVSGGLCNLEVLDQIAAAQWLGSRHFVNARRIGIWGWSYGGTMTLRCVLQGPEAFAAGIAVAPVTDWRDYDTAYTERYMGTPEDNPEGYRIGSPITRARTLKRPILLVHGFMDDNVHFRGAVAFLSAAQRGGRAVDQDFYPRGAHGIGGRTERLVLYRRMERFWAENLAR